MTSGDRYPCEPITLSYYHNHWIGEGEAPAEPLFRMDFGSAGASPSQVDLLR